MATKTSMIITATDYVTEHDQQKTITDINPQANDAHLRTWAQETIAMTKDTYKGSKRIDVIDLDNDARQTRNPVIKFQYTSTTSTYTNGTARIPISKLWASTNIVAGYIFSLKISDGVQDNPTVIPVVTLSDVVGNSFAYIQNSSYVKQGPYAADPDYWVFTIKFLEQAASTFNINVSIAAGDGYQPYSITIPIELYDDTEESDSDG